MLAKSMFFMVLLCAALAFNSRAEDIAEQPTEIKILSEPVYAKRTWTHRGFATPQQTLATYVWAIRELDLECVRECIEAPNDADVTLTFIKSANKVGYGYQPLAKRIVDGNTVDLKVRLAVVGQGKTIVTFRFCRVGEVWKINNSSESLGSDW